MGDGGRYGMRAPADVQGPDCADFPSGLAVAPVLWDYLDQKLQFQFKAGFVGAKQDPDTGVVKPEVGWFISHARVDDGEGKELRKKDDGGLQAWSTMVQKLRDD